MKLLLPALMLLMAVFGSYPAAQAQLFNPDSGLEAEPAQSFNDHSSPVLFIEPSEGLYTGGDIVSIFGSFFQPPLSVTMVGVPQQVISVTGTEIIVWTQRPDVVSCTALSGPTVVTELETGDQISGPIWTYLPPPECNQVPSPCVPQTDKLCLHGERFSVEVNWSDFQSNSGRGRIASASDSSGVFWFFHPDNWEMHVKVLDGCNLNDHIWFYSAASTDVEFVLRIVDHVSGAAREYSNPLGAVAAAVRDTRAFVTCLAPTSFHLQADRSSIPPGGAEIILLATLVSMEGFGVPRVRVEFSAEIGTFQASTMGSVRTDLGGQAIEVLTITAADLQAVDDRGMFVVAATVSAGGETLTSDLIIFLP